MFTVCFLIACTVFLSVELREYPAFAGSATSFAGESFCVDCQTEALCPHLKGVRSDGGEPTKVAIRIRNMLP